MQALSMPMRLFVIACGVATLAGCSSATDYSEAVTTFANATTAADSALSDLNKTATVQYTNFLSRRAQTDMHVAVLARDKDCGLTSAQCRLVLIDPDTPGKEQLFPPDPLLENMVVVMGQIRQYAENLAALVADDSAAKAQADVNAALASVEALADTVNKADGKGAKSVPSFATPVGAGVNWLVGQYADHVKLEGLRTATSAAKDVIERAAALFQNAALFGSDPQRKQFTKDLGEKIDAYSLHRDSETDLNAAVAAAKLYNDFLQTKPGDTFLEMGKAHSALADALQNSDVSWPQVIAKIRAFAAQAKALAKIAQNLAAVATTK